MAFRGFSKKFRLKRYFKEISPHFRDTYCFGPRDFSNDNLLCAMIYREFSETHFNCDTVDRELWLALVRVHMNVVPPSTGNTNNGTRELTLKCKFKCYLNP